MMRDVPEVARIERAKLGRLALRGADAADFLQRMTSNDLAAVREGEGAATLLLERTGRFIDRLIACHAGPGEWLVICGPDRGPAVRDALQRFIFAEDLRLDDLSGSTSLVTVLGSAAAETLHARLGVPAEELARFHHREAAAVGPGARVIRAEDVGGRAFHVVVPTVSRGALEQRLEGVPLLDEDGWRTVRVASGVPEFGEEFSERTVAIEAGMEDAISFTKGCYVGQEVIARVVHHDRIRKTLVRVRLKGEAVPPRGAKLAHGDDDAGEISSAVRCRGGEVLGLAYVRTGFETPGNRLSVIEADGRREAEVLAP
ncbi:MAG: CAF17-like 4Fe-4S cluster assembly/insertion protein YgfZ [Candidatus Eiseniibacteriota bacterium]